MPKRPAKKRYGGKLIPYEEWEKIMAAKDAEGESTTTETEVKPAKKEKPVLEKVSQAAADKGDVTITITQRRPNGKLSTTSYICDSIHVTEDVDINFVPTGKKTTMDVTISAQVMKKR